MHDYRDDHIGSYDKSLCPTFLRPELDTVSVEIEPTPFVDDMVAHFIEWDALPEAIKRNFNFDKYLTQK